SVAHEDMVDFFNTYEVAAKFSIPNDDESKSVCLSQCLSNDLLQLYQNFEQQYTVLHGVNAIMPYDYIKGLFLTHYRPVEEEQIQVAKFNSIQQQHGENI